MFREMTDNCIKKLHFLRLIDTEYQIGGKIFFKSTYRILISLIYASIFRLLKEVKTIGVHMNQPNRNLSKRCL